MKVILFCIIACLFQTAVSAQYTFNTAISTPYTLHSQRFKGYTVSPPPAKLYQRNRGVIVGLQRGNITAIELGGEAHWRKLSIKKPNIYGATVNMEYNFGHNVIGYKAGMWMKHGRVNLTYGANVAYYNDFDGRSRYGIGPAVGFRLLGFHLVNGYNFLAGDKEFDNVNKMYVTLRYYFPVENKFVWDKNGKESRIKDREKKKKQKEKARAKKQKLKEKEQRKKQREKEGKPRLFDVF